MDFREFCTGSLEYDASLTLRQRILRAPVGLDLKSEDLSLEKNYYHFGLFEDTCILACVIAVALENGKVKLRQMAVSEELQGKGLGTKLLNSATDILKKKGFKEIELNARKTAVDFYRKNAYEICSDEFIEVNIPHFKMNRFL